MNDKYFQILFIEFATRAQKYKTRSAPNKHRDNPKHNIYIILQKEN